MYTFFHKHIPRPSEIVKELDLVIKQSPGGWWLAVTLLDQDIFFEDMALTRASSGLEPRVAKVIGIGQE